MQQNQKLNDEEEDNIIDWSQVFVKPKDITLNNENE